VRRAALPAAADVVVVGGGVMGTSIAFHLAEAGAQVVLCERGELAGGSTSRAAGGVRAQFSDALNVQLGVRSLAAFRDFGERPGWEIDFRPVGYLFLLTTAQQVAAFEAAIALQHEYGVPSRLVTASEARELSPLLEVGDVLAGAFSPQEGHASPEGVVQGYAAGARTLGAHVAVGCEVREIVVRGGEIRAVVTERGRIATGTVVCAAGAWSGSPSVPSPTTTSTFSVRSRSSRVRASWARSGQRSMLQT
jgi:sarcosine oxidase subunit beta